MKFTKLLIALFVFASVTFAQNGEAKKDNVKKYDLKNFQDSVSYAIGINITKNLKDPAMKINFDCLLSAMSDQVKGNAQLKDEVVQKVLMEFNRQMMAEKNKQMEAIKEQNKKEGLAFLEINKKKEGVVTLPDGLQYKVLTSGKGPSPKKEDTVKVNYRGTLIDGREFDSSYGRGEPTEFPVDKVIKGWTEALQKMKVGDKWELYIPAELAYGENGAGEMIKPNSVLIFEVELLEVKPKK
jgi:FKBP-type peptidyl-prolyl cis-trans isomerase FklB